MSKVVILATILCVVVTILFVVSFSAEQNTTQRMVDSNRKIFLVYVK